MQLMNRLVLGVMPVVPKQLVGRVASRYIAGERQEDALAMVAELNKRGAMGTIDLLGEHTDTPEEAEKAAQTYISILDNIAARGLDSNVSLKPTHLGLALGYDLCFKHVRRIVEHAKDKGNFLRIDMEDHPYTDDTLRMFLKLHEEFDNVGVVIQAYLRRTVKDLARLIEVRANLRLCKGIYNEPRQIAYKNRRIIIDNYAYILEKLLKAGCYVGIATHCEETVWHALRLIDELGLKRDQYEFQMLLGVEEELRDILLEQGHRMRIYVPYGSEWYAYSTRRLKENPNMAGYVLRDFLKLEKRDGLAGKLG